MAMEARREQIQLVRDLVGRDWKMLCRVLGLTEAELQGIEVDAGRRARERAHQGLIKWSKKTKPYATVDALSKALLKIQRVDISESLMSSVKAEIIHLTFDGETNRSDQSSSQVRKVTKAVQESGAVHNDTIICVTNCQTHKEVKQVERKTNASHSDLASTDGAEERTLIQCKNVKTNVGVINNKKEQEQQSDSPEPMQCEFINPLVEKAHIDIVCNSIAREWKMLGRLLQLTEGALDCIADDCNHNCKECVYQSLKEWQKIEGPRATVTDLQEALLSLGRRDVKDALMKYVTKL